MTKCAPIYRRVRPLLGTWFEMRLQREPIANAHAAMTEAFELATRLERIFNAFDCASELSQLNRARCGALVSVSVELAQVLELGSRIELAFGRRFRLMPACHHASPCYELTGQTAVRLTECQFDLGGIAKGYIVDRVFEWLKPMGTGTLSVNAGGDLRICGAQQVEVRVPGSGSGDFLEQAFVMPVRDAAVATSSIGTVRVVGRASARYFDEVPNATCRTVTIVAANCAVADAMTKVALFGELDREAAEPFAVQAVLRL